MTDLSKTVILEILEKVNTQDLRSLAITVSQGLLKNKINTRTDATQAILNYSPNEVSILRRKIITRELLFSYLHDKKIPITLPVTKSELIDKIVSLGKLSTVSNNWHPSEYYEDETPAENDMCSSLQPQTSKEMGCIETTNTSGESMYFMAQQFSQWFYNMLNEHSPIGTEHFYSDVCLKLNIYINEQCSSDTVTNDPEEASALLFRRRMEHGLYFNPNLSSEGSQGRMDPHGLVMVLTCGTLHANNVCVGVFEQVFSLARDPFADNNWKIKNTELNLRSRQGIMSVPTLCDSDLTNNYLALPDR